MSNHSTTSAVSIRLRAQAQDRYLIDQAAKLVGASRSQFMLVSALRDAKNVLLDQTTVYVDGMAFQAVMDAPTSASEAAGTPAD